MGAEAAGAVEAHRISDVFVGKCGGNAQDPIKPCPPPSVNHNLHQLPHHYFYFDTPLHASTSTNLESESADGGHNNVKHSLQRHETFYIRYRDAPYHPSCGAGRFCISGMVPIRGMSLPMQTLLSLTPDSRQDHLRSWFCSLEHLRAHSGIALF